MSGTGAITLVVTRRIAGFQAPGATVSFANVSGRWSLSQVDNSSSAGKFLRDDGSWQVVPDVDLPVAANVAGLATLRTDQISSGHSMRAWVTSLKCAWTWDPACTLGVDGITVAAGYGSPGAGRWVRDHQTSREWQKKTLFIINAANGNDENDGQTSNTAIKSFAEWFRRTGGLSVDSVTLQIDDATSLDAFTYAYGPCDGASGTNNILFITLPLVQFATGTMTAAGTAHNPATNTPAKMTDTSVSSWAAHINRFVYTTSGALKQAVIEKDLGSGVAALGPWTDTFGNVVSPPTNGTTYKICEPTPLTISEPDYIGSAYVWIMRAKVNDGLRSRKAWRILFSECSFPYGPAYGGYSWEGAQILSSCISTDFTLEGGGVCLLQGCGGHATNSGIAANGGSRIIVVNSIFDGFQIDTGHGIAGVLLPGGGYIGLAGDVGLFNSPDYAIKADNGGQIRVANGGTLFGNGNAGGAQIFSGSLQFYSASYVPTLTGTIELADINHLSGWTWAAWHAAGRNVLTGDGGRIVGSISAAGKIYTGSLVVSGNGTGIGHFDSSGNLTSSALTAAEIPSTLNATTFAGAVFIQGDLTVQGTHTYVDSTTVQVADRVIQVNKPTTAGAIPVPVNICGISVSRGNTGSAERDSAGIFWVESSTLFRLAFNTGNDDSTLGADVGLQVGSLKVSSLGTGIGHYSSTGVLSSSLIVDADVSSSAAISTAKLAVPSGATGDLLVGSSTSLVRLAVGASGTVLKGGTSPSWATIVNADVDAAAAIAGTKISPDFGSQNIVTTGNASIGAGGKATVGEARFGSTAGTSKALIATRNNANTANMAVAYMDTGDGLWIGSDNGGTTSVVNVRVNGSTSSALYVGGTAKITCTSTTATINDTTVDIQSGGTSRFKSDGTGTSVNGASPVAKQTVTGSRGGNAALADLLTKLATWGVITDGTSA